ncbi:MAG: dihydroorotate dehydrogenase [Sphaerochaetaceae bacterium]
MRPQLFPSDHIPLATVSGVVTTNEEMIRFFDTEVPAVDIITTKSFQVVPNPGNPEPVICETERGCFGNSVGLKNIGMEAAVEEMRRLRPMRALLNISLSASNPEDFITLVNAFIPYADMLELNFSCPHAARGYGASIGCDAGIAATYVRRIREAFPSLSVPLFVKLTPNVADIGAIAKSVVAAGADGITAINTVGPIVHIDPDSGESILINQVGGKGGKSGRWVFSTAVSSIRSIRKAVGPDVPIIGMGGVSTGEDAALLVEAGANAIGIGSALGMVAQWKWQEYLSAVGREAEAILTDGRTKIQSASFLRTERRMAYHRYRIQKKEWYGSDTVIITLDGSLPSHAGEFVFIWLPGVGEKPFSVATTKPLRFIIKDRGPFTKRLCALGEGDCLYVRGLYGKPVRMTSSRHAILLAGGTGVAVLPMLCEELRRQCTEITVLVGTSENVSGPGLFSSILKRYGRYVCIPDDGKPGRVLASLDSLSLANDTVAYVVGPTKFMAVACRKLLEKGIKPERISLSLEKMTRCGIGLCGECAVGDRLTCQWGTFMSYDWILANAPELLS